MKNIFLLSLGICCLISINSCQKEPIDPLTEATTLTTETADKYPYFTMNSLEDLKIFEERFVQNEIAISRSMPNGNIVHVPANSINAIQAAIAEAGQGGVVYLEKGNHYEEQTILITHTVFIIGRKEARIFSTNRLDIEMKSRKPLFEISQATQVIIWGLEMHGIIGGADQAVVIDKATRTIIAHNTIIDFQVGIGVRDGDNTFLWKNNFIGTSTLSRLTTPQGFNGEVQPKTGVLISNGTDIKIIQNYFSKWTRGIVASDKNGLIQNNELFGNNSGILLGYNLIQTVAGAVESADFPATNWTVQNNYSYNNIEFGYIVTNGANHNKLINNRGDNNGQADLLLDKGGLTILGFPKVVTYDNFVDIGNNKGFTIIDCGANQVISGKMLPCD